MPVTIDQVMNSGGAARSYMWDVEVKKMNANFNFRCTSSSQPEASIEKITNDIRGFTVPEAGAVSWNDITFNYIENQPFEMIQSLWDWLQQEWDTSGGVHTDPELASGRGDAAETKIILNDLDGSPKVTWTLHGCVLTGAVGLPDTSSDKAGKYEGSFTVSYAHATKS